MYLISVYCCCLFSSCYRTVPQAGSDSSLLTVFPFFKGTVSTFQLLLNGKQRVYCERGDGKLTCDKCFEQQGFILFVILQHPFKVFLFPLDGHLTTQFRSPPTALSSSRLRSCRGGYGVSMGHLTHRSFVHAADVNSYWYLLTPELSSCRSWAVSSASSHSFPISQPAPWGPTSEKPTSMIDVTLYWSLCILCGNRISHQVVVGEPCDLLLYAVLNLSLRWQRRHVVQYLLLLFDVVSKQLNLSVKGFEFIFVLPGLSLQLSLQQPEGTMIIRLFLACSSTNTKKQKSSF